MITYINVPFGDKDKAKRLGARFDMEKKSWYVPDGIDLELFKNWLPKNITKFWEKKFL